VNIDREYYLAAVIDRSKARPVVIFSQAGGMEIEEVAARSPEWVLKEFVDPKVGWMPFQAKNLVYSLDPLPGADTVKRNPIAHGGLVQGVHDSRLLPGGDQPSGHHQRGKGSCH